MSKSKRIRMELACGHNQIQRIPIILLCGVPFGVECKKGCGLQRVVARKEVKR